MEGGALAYAVHASSSSLSSAGAGAGAAAAGAAASAARAGRRPPLAPRRSGAARRAGALSAPLRAHGSAWRVASMVVGAVGAGDGAGGAGRGAGAGVVVARGAGKGARAGGGGGLYVECGPPKRFKPPQTRFRPLTSFTPGQIGSPARAAPRPAAMAGLDEQIASAKALVEDQPKQAVVALRKLVFDVPGTDVDTTRVKEAAIGALADAYVKLGDARSLADLLSQLREFFGAIPKAKTAKIVRGIIDQIAKIPDSTQLQVGGAGAGRRRRQRRGGACGRGASARARRAAPRPPLRRAHRAAVGQRLQRVQSQRGSGRCGGGAAPLGRPPPLHCGNGWVGVGWAGPHRGRSSDAAPAPTPAPRVPRPRPTAQVEVCKEQAEWARAEKRTFLRQRIELRLAALYLQLQDYPTALSILGT
jgi:hypothetical protein